MARLKSSMDVGAVIEAAVRFYEEPPRSGMTVETDSSDIRLSADDWAEAFETPDPGTPHNDARDQVWESVLSILMDKYDGDEDGDLVRKSLQQNRDLLATFNRAWPLLEATDLVGDLWSVPAYLRRCAPRLSADDVRTLQRADPTPGPPPTCRCWTRPGIGSATRRRPGARGGRRPSSPPNASAWPSSSMS